jgi:hypothetical protein
MPTPCAEAPCALRVTEAGALVRTDLAAHVDTTLVASGVKRSCGWYAFSPDGRFLLVELNEGAAVVETARWTRVAGPWKGRGAQWSHEPGVGATLVACDGAKTVVVDVAAGRETTMPSGTDCAAAPLVDGRVAAAHDGVVDLVGVDGAFIRRLYPPEK